MHKRVINTKTVLVTGALSGIGLQTALLFSRHGWNVAAADRHTNIDASLLADNVRTYILDVRDRHSIDNCIAQVLKDFGQIDALINNAGVYDTSPLELTSSEKTDNIIDTNVKGVLYMIQAILPYFRANNTGVIVNTSSVLGRTTLPFQSVYHTSKWAIEGLSESLHYELMGSRIRIKVVEPGVIKTNLYRSVLNPITEQYPTQYKSRFESWHRCLMSKYENGYSPELIAKTIFKATNDTSHKLRYTADFATKALIALHNIVPLRLFQRIICMASKLR